MRLGPAPWIFWQHGFIKLDATMVFTWALMLGLTLCAWGIIRKLSTSHRRSRRQNVLEIVVTGIEGQIADVGLRQPRVYLPFVGTLFLFVATAALCTIVPGFEPPTGSLSTTTALAICVFGAVLAPFQTPFQTPAADLHADTSSAVSAPATNAAP